MKQKLTALALLLCLLLQGTVFANPAEAEATPPETETSPYLITEAYYYVANLYYCDAERNKIVLKNVKPIGIINAENRRTAEEAEYQEIAISGSGRLQNGEYLPLEELNYYADSNVGVMIVRCASQEIRAVALRFR